MAIKTQMETFRTLGKVCELNPQTAVECKFGQDAVTVLSANATAALSGAEAGNGEVRYFGKALFSLVYEDAEKHVCRAEKGVEFTARVQDEHVCPAMTARANIAVENVSVRREGASVYLTALLGADISLFGDCNIDYLADGEIIVRHESFAAVTAHLCGGATEAEDEFETDCIGDILLHSESVNVTDVVCETGTLCAEGEINLGILALKGENDLVSFERLVPFRVEIPCEEAAFNMSGEAHVSVGGVALRAEADETRGKCKITAEFSLNVEGCVYEEVSIDGIADAYSKECKLKVLRGELNSCGAGEIVRLTERISGRAALSGTLDFSDALQAVTLQRAEANIVNGEDGKRLEGVELATLLVRGSDGSHRGIEMSLPFSIPVQVEGDCTVSVFACGTAARQKQEGEIEVEATLKITVQRSKRIRAEFVTGVEEGEPIIESDSAISVFIPRAGDGLWELSKQLNKSPEEVAENNPDIEFPVKEGQRVIIYRKKSLNK